MNNKTKVVAALIPVAALASVAPAVSQVDAAEDYTITDVVFDYEGQASVLTYTEYSGAVLDGEGATFDFTTSNSLTAIGIGNDTYISYDDFAEGILEGKGVNEILTELAETPVDSSDYQDIAGIGDDGVPEYDDGEVPEVIDIY